MKRLFILIFLLASITSAGATSFEQITVATSAIGFTSATITPGAETADYAYCRVETAQIRYTYNGTTPTTTVGTLLETGDIVCLDDASDIKAFRAIRTGSTSGQLNCHYEFYTGKLCDGGKK